jgi:enoyl-CoA hydratase/carnithine racemase
MNRPQVRNGINEQMAAQMLRAVQLAASDESVRVLRLSGAGTAFCSGADLGGFAKFVCKFTPLMALTPDLGSSWPNATPI